MVCCPQFSYEDLNLVCMVIGYEAVMTWFGYAWLLTYDQWLGKGVWLGEED